MKKILVILLSLMLLLSGCTGQKKISLEEELGNLINDAKGMRIGVSLLNHQQTFFQDLKNGMEEVSTKTSVELIAKSADRDLYKQIEDIKGFIADDLDAIILSPVDSEGIKTVVNQALEAGIIVLTVDIAVNNVEVDCHIASDNIQGGEMAGKLAVKLLKDQGNVVIIDHYGITSVDDRINGFENILNDYSTINIIAKKDSMGTKQNATEIIQELIRAKVDIDLIFAINEDTSIGAYEAIKGVRDAQDIIIIGYDGTDLQQQLINDKDNLKASVVQDAREIGRQSIINAIKLYNDVPVLNEILVDVKMMN